MSARISTDYLVIGSGIAGLRAAVSLAAHGRVLILTKAEPRAGSTDFAQGGIAAAVGDDDSPDRHAADTLAAGDGLSDPAAVRVLVEEGPSSVRELIAWGAAFDRDAKGRLSLAREGAHSVRRVLHARDATGREIGRVLFARVREQSQTVILDHALVSQLLVEDGVVAGVRFLDAKGRLGEVRARATLVATGGAGQVYRETTNPQVGSGDGIALSYFAGARVSDVEFVQFHPTALSVPGVPRYLLSEALRGEGARLVNAAGEHFMSRYEPAGELAPRDRVARAIVLEMARTGAPVSLTMAHLPPDVVRATFPLVTELCRRAGLDLASDPIPTAPAAHYMMGGVATDLDGRTSLPGLFAAGEAACTGVHGANRLASNSLLEGLVFGARAAAAMAGGSGTWPNATTPRVSPPPEGPAFAVPIQEAEVRELMWNKAGVFRDQAGLQAVLDVLDPVSRAIDDALERGRSIDPATWRLVSLATLGRLIAHAALRREESRGAHSRTDFTARDDVHFKTHLSDIRA